MSLSGYWSDLWSGQPFGSTDDAQALSDTTDQANLAADQAYTARQVAAGTLTQSQADAYNQGAAVDLGVNNSAQSVNALTQSLAAQGITAYGTLDVAGQVDQAAVQGAKDAAAAYAKDIAGAANATAKGVLGFAWTALPWWVWIGLGIAVFFYFGGGILLRAEGKRAFRSRYGDS